MVTTTEAGSGNAAAAPGASSPADGTAEPGGFDAGTARPGTDAAGQPWPWAGEVAATGGPQARVARPARPEGVVVVTDRTQVTRPLVDVVAAAVAGGARFVLLREKDLPRSQRLRLAVALRELLRPAGGTLIVAGQDTLDGEALHLRAGAVAPLGRPRLLGRSCHGEGELGRLSTEDYVTLSPVFPSLSKPGYGPALEPAGLRRLTARAGRPVLALGGVETADQAAACRDAGVAGVAVMGAVMRADDPAEVFARLRAGWDGVCDGSSRDGGRVLA